MKKGSLYNLSVLLCVVLTLLFAGCVGDDFMGASGSNNGGSNASWSHDELGWVFDMNVLPEVRINITEQQWNELLMAYDENSGTSHYIHCDAEFKSKGES